MAAILRSGKFLRIVSGLTRQRTEVSSDERGKSGPQGTSNSPLITSSYSGSVQQFHSLSLQQLYNALPVLNPEQEQDKKKNDDTKLHLLERRGSDPLLEFYVDKQKLEEAAKSFNVIDQDKGHIGLNLVKELKEEEKTENEPVVKVTVQKSNNEAVSEQDKPKDTLVKEEQQPVQFTLPTITITEPPNECSNENAKTVESVSIGSETEAIEADAATAETEILDETAAAKPVQLVPLCQDPISHEWYPLPVVCQMFRSQGRIYDLEALLWGSQGIRPEDRKCIYFWTLQTYADCGMFPQAVDLTRRLETEGLGLEFPEYHSLMNGFAMAMYNQQKRKDLDTHFLLCAI